MEEKVPTLEEIQGTIRAAGDSVWVIEDTLQKLADGATPDIDLKGNLERNVGHLKIVTTSQHVIDSEEDISGLLAGIDAGEEELAKEVWAGITDERRV